MVKLAIVTPSSRPKNLAAMLRSIEPNCPGEVEWIIYHDMTVNAEVPPDVLKMTSAKLNLVHKVYWSGGGTSWGYKARNMALEVVGPETWLYFLDDDCSMHPNFWRFVPSATVRTTERAEPRRVIVFGQQRDLPRKKRKDIHVGSQGCIGPEIGHCMTDLGQVLWRRDAIGGRRFQEDSYEADGQMLMAIHGEHQEWFSQIFEVCSNYNDLPR